MAAVDSSKDIGIIELSRDAIALVLMRAKGGESALRQVIPLVHHELHRIARRCMAGERAGETLEARVRRRGVHANA